MATVEELKMSYSSKYNTLANKVKDLMERAYAGKELDRAFNIIDTCVSRARDMTGFLDCVDSASDKSEKPLVRNLVTQMVNRALSMFNIPRTYRTWDDLVRDVRSGTFKDLILKAALENELGVQMPGYESQRVSRIERALARLL